MVNRNAGDSSPVAIGNPGYDRFAKTPANHRPLTPLAFIEWAATAFASRTAVIDGETRYTYAQFYERCCRLAGGLAALGVHAGETVAVIGYNSVAMLEAHYGAPMLGAVICPLNPGLSPAMIAYMLDHSECKVLLVDPACAEVVADAVSIMARRPRLVDLTDPTLPNAPRIGERTYDELLSLGSANFAWPGPEDEWQAISLCYTSGTEGMPKGVVLHHRGAYLDATGDVISSGMNRSSVYLWTLPMHRANGWCYVWAVTAVGGTHVLCRDASDTRALYAAIAEHGVTHLCTKRTILDLLAHAPDDQVRAFPRPVTLDVAGAAPPEDVIARARARGFDVNFLYTMTECFGVAAVCSWRAGEGQEESDGQGPHLLAHPGIHYPCLDRVIVADPETLEELPADGVSEGEVLLRGNTVMLGYLKDPEATEDAFRGGWYHTGDIGVLHPDGHIEIIERAEDLVFPGDAPLHSSVIEQALLANPAIAEAAVVAYPHQHLSDAMQERLCAFVVMKEGIAAIAEEALQSFAATRLPSHAVPERIVLMTELPRTEEGEVQKYRLRMEAQALLDAAA